MVKRVKCWLQEKSKLTQENTKAFSLLVTSVWRHWENIMLASRIMIVLSIISQLIFFVTFKAFFVVVSKQRNKINELKTLCFTVLIFVRIKKHSFIREKDRVFVLVSNFAPRLRLGPKNELGQKLCFFSRIKMYHSFTAQDSKFDILMNWYDRNKPLKW